MKNSDIKIKIFRYIPELEPEVCFLPSQEYKEIAEKLWLSEWTDVVWICRYIALDNDYGEHIFDNWKERESIEEKASKNGYNAGELLIVVPDRFQDGKDGPCHSQEYRRKFWRDILDSLQLSLETIFEEARYMQKERYSTEGPLPDLENRISQIRDEYVKNLVP